MYSYTKKIKRGVTKTVKWILAVPVGGSGTNSYSKNKAVINRQVFKRFSFYLSLVFFIVITLSFLMPALASADFSEVSMSDPTASGLHGGETRTITKVFHSLKNMAESGIGGYINKKASEVTAQMAVIVLQFTSLILGIAGMLLDYVINFTITDLGTNIQKMKEGGINTAWTMLRDLANMLFIFVLLYVSIATIIQLSSVDTKRMLKNVVIVALLINFSMFFTEVVIDVTNTFASAFHGAIISTVEADPDYAATGKPPEEISISQAFMNSTKLLPSFFDGENNSAAISKAADGDFYTTIALSLVLFVFILVLSFVFLAGAFFLIVRFIMFILLIILSPLAFVSVIIPQTSGSFQRWFKSLVNNALFAPIFMALLWVSLVLLKETEDLPEGMTLASAATGNLGSNADVVVTDSSAAVFAAILAIGFVFAALLISKTLSIHGASKATQIGSKWSRAALRTGYRGARGGGAFVANRTLGKYAAKRADSQELKDRAAKGSRWANMQLMAYDKLSETGKKGGYRGVEDRRRRKAKKRAELYNTSAREKDLVRTLQEQAKDSGDPAKIKAAQQERDRVLGVDSKELQKREKTLNNLVNQELDLFQEEHKMKIEELKKENEDIKIRNEKRKQEGRGEEEMEKEKDLPKPLTNDTLQVKKRELLREKRDNMMQNEGIVMQEQLSQEQKLKSEYVKSIKDNILTNNAHIRESLRELKKEDKS